MKHFIFITLITLTKTFSTLPPPIYVNDFSGIEAKGVTEKGLNMNSENSYSLPPLSGTSWSVSVWHNIHSGNGFNATVQSIARNGFETFRNSISSYGVLIGIDSSNNPVYNQWNFYSFTYDNNTLSIYENGIFLANYNVGSSPIVSEIINMSSMEKTIDNVAIFDTNLNTDQITSLFQLGMSSDSANSFYIGNPLTVSTSTLTVGDSLSLSTNLSDPSWFSHDTSIISINNLGVVTALSTGSTRVGVYDKSNPALMIQSTEISVQEVPSSTFEIAPKQNDNFESYNIYGQKQNKKTSGISIIKTPQNRIHLEQ